MAVAEKRILELVGRDTAQTTERQVLAQINLGSVMDTDLPPVNRTEANLWKAMYFQQVQETRNSNKGIRRLQRSLENARRTDTSPQSR